MTFQNCKALSEPIQQIGCELLCWIAALCHFSREDLSAIHINFLKSKLMEARVWSDKGGLFRPDTYRVAANLFAAYCGSLDLWGDQIGVFENSGPRYWKWVKNPKTLYVIERYETYTEDTHSILMSNTFRTIYDPSPSTRILGLKADFLYFVGTRSEWDYLTGT